MSTPENKAAEQAQDNVQQGIDISQGAAESSLARLAELALPWLQQAGAAATAFPQNTEAKVAANRGEQMGQYQGLTQQLSERQSQTGASQAGQQRQAAAATGQGIANAATGIRAADEQESFQRLLQMLSANSQYANQASGYEFAPANVAVGGASALGPAIQAEANQTTGLGGVLGILAPILGTALAGPLGGILGGLFSAAPTGIGNAGAGTTMGQNLIGTPGLNFGAFQS